MGFDDQGYHSMKACTANCNKDAHSCCCYGDEWTCKIPKFGVCDAVCVTQKWTVMNVVWFVGIILVVICCFCLCWKIY